MKTNIYEARDDKNRGNRKQTRNLCIETLQSQTTGRLLRGLLADVSALDKKARSGNRKEAGTLLQY